MAEATKTNQRSAEHLLPIVLNSNTAINIKTQHAIYQKAISLIGQGGFGARNKSRGNRHRPIRSLGECNEVDIFTTTAYRGTHSINSNSAINPSNK